MNLFDCWKEAKEGQKIRRLCSGDDYTVTKKNSYISDYGNIVFDNCEYIHTKSLFADDWEVVKVPRKVVIEGVQITEFAQSERFSITTRSTYGRQAIVPYYKEQSLPRDVNMKMTLEWEE